MRIQAAILLLAARAFAQTHDHMPPAPASAGIDLAKLPAPQHIEGIGHSHIAIATKSAGAQEWFDQGLALFHCFWDYESLRAFEHAARLDPDCAMCHWGISQALYFRGTDNDLAQAELKKARELSSGASDYEQRLIRAYADSDEKTGDEATRVFNQGMESLINRYPGDIEAKLLFAGRLNGGYDAKGDPRPGALYAQSILRDILRDQPDNAAANHYMIHALENGPHPEAAMENAQKLVRLAPASGHMVHMPGHIFYKTGDYERARQTFLDSLRVDREYMASQHVSADDDWNFEHNLSYLVADCAEAGRYQEARGYAQELERALSDPGPLALFNFNIMQIVDTETRLASRFAKWDDIIDRPVRFDVPEAELTLATRSYRDGVVDYARGMKAAESGQGTGAERYSDALDGMLWRISQEDLKDDAKSARDRVVKLLGVMSLELRGLIAGRKSDLESARMLLEQAEQRQKELGSTDPPRYSRSPLEVWGDILVRARKFEDARKVYRRVLEDRPHSGWALYGIARAWREEGNRAEAMKAFREFLAAWAQADPDLEQLKDARAYLAIANR